MTHNPLHFYRVEQVLGGKLGVRMFRARNSDQVRQWCAENGEPEVRLVVNTGHDSAYGIAPEVDVDLGDWPHQTITGKAYAVRINETCSYVIEVEADSMAEAEGIATDRLIQAEDRDQYFNCCEDREVVHAEEIERVQQRGVEAQLAHVIAGGCSSVHLTRAEASEIMQAMARGARS